MIPSVLKSLMGWSPAIAASFASATGSFMDPALLKESAGYAAAIIFYGLWRQGEASKKEAWKEVEEARKERDEARTRCADCPGNYLRLERLK